MSDLVGNPEDRFSHNEAHITSVPGSWRDSCFSSAYSIYCGGILRVGQGWISPKFLDSGQWKVCHWSLVADEGYSITIQITELNLRPKFRGDCLLNVIKVCIGATARALSV